MGDEQKNQEAYKQSNRGSFETETLGQEGPQEGLQEGFQEGFKGDGLAQTHTRKPKTILNILLIVILMAVAAGFYLYQKGYLNRGLSFLDTALPKQHLSLKDEQENRHQAFMSGSEERLPEEIISAQEFKALQHRVDQLETQLRQFDQGQQGPITASATRSAIHQKGFAYLDLKFKVLSGYPFVEELEQAKSFLTEDDYRTLRELAPFGVPKFEFLKNELPEILRIINFEQEESEATSFRDKIMTQLKHLIVIEKLSSPKDQTPLGKAALNLTPQSVPSMIKAIEAAQSKYPRLATDERLNHWALHAHAYNRAVKILTNTHAEG